MTPHTAGLSPTPACADPFVHHMDEQPPIGGRDAAKLASADLEPPTSLLGRLNSEQRDSFLQVLRAAGASPRSLIRFPRSGLGPRRHNPVGRYLDRVHRCLSTSPTDFGSCSLLPFEISVPRDSSPLTSRPYRVNPLVAKQMDTILDEDLAAGLMQHSTSPYANPVVIIRKISGGFGSLSTAKS